MSRLIDADELLRRYDETHEGPPERARKLIEEAPTVVRMKEEPTVARMEETLLLYRYGTILRPAGPGAVPRDGLHAIEEGIVTPYGKPFWSLVDYERRLTDEEIKQYELVFIGRVEVKR